MSKAKEEILFSIDSEREGIERAMNHRDPHHQSKTCGVEDFSN